MSRIEWWLKNVWNPVNAQRTRADKDLRLSKKAVPGRRSLSLYLSLDLLIEKHVVHTENRWQTINTHILDAHHPFNPSWHLPKLSHSYFLSWAFPILPNYLAYAWNKSADKHQNSNNNCSSSPVQQVMLMYCNINKTSFGYWIKLHEFKWVFFF